MPLLGDQPKRMMIAKLIAPNAYWGDPQTNHEQEDALALADRILTALTEAERAGVGKGLREALRWYGDQAQLAKLLHSGGDAARDALVTDGGKRAREALSKE